MCIMAIHAQSTTANAIQAMAHNADTLIRDLDQLAHLLHARREWTRESLILMEKWEMERQAKRLWEVWRGLVGPDAIPHGTISSTGHEADRVLDAGVRAEAESEHQADDMEHIADVSNG